MKLSPTQFAQATVAGAIGVITPVVGMLEAFNAIHWTSDQLAALMIAANAVGAAAIGFIQGVWGTNGAAG